MARSNRGLRFALAATLLICMASVAVLFYQFRNRGAQKLGAAAVSKLSENTIMYLDRVRQTATKDGSVRWELAADSAELESGGKKMILNAPRVAFFLQNGSQVHLTADKGILHTSRNDIEVRGNVNVRSDRYQLSTQSLVYQHDRNRLESDQPVRISGDQIDLTALTMVYDLNTDQAKFKGQVDGVIKESPGESLSL
jgi:LPS export ABC transporter protein LptC